MAWDMRNPAKSTVRCANWNLYGLRTSPALPTKMRYQWSSTNDYATQPASERRHASMHRSLHGK